MGRLEATLKAEISRLARKEVRAMIAKPAEEVRRLRQRVASLERDLRSAKAARAEERAKAKVRTAVQAVASNETPTVRMSPTLIRSLRNRLGISQADLAKLVGVSTVAVGNWESGKSKPRPESKARVAALRGLGRREIKRLLAG
ncbi:MAG: helix-turn-helix transcriptional regulator [Phycisphaerae bacterium]|nr:helix-turn-helix transcriptional regulator [Phycisphaerae bacterium]